jgi:hypothetical protein
MVQSKRSNKKWFFVAAIVVIAGGLVSWVVLTSGKEPAATANPGPGSSRAEPQKADKFVGGAHVQRDLAESALPAELKEKMAAWQKEGFIKELKVSEHEVWINGNAWNTYSLDDKNNVADALSAYMKAHDGTPQVMVREFGTNKMLAEILGDYRDFN